MTIWIAQQLPLFNFERLDILCAWIWPPFEKLWPFEFLESFRCSMSNVSIYYEPESDLRVKIYDHLNCSRASVVQFRASRYIMRLNRKSEWIVMTIWIGQELKCSISSVLIYYAPESDLRVKSYDHLNFSRTSVVQFFVSIYCAPESDLRVKSYDHLNCSRPSIVQLRASRYIMRLNQKSEWIVMTIWIGQELKCSISSVLIYYPPESDLRVKSYDHMNISRASVVQFCVSRYIMRLNLTSVWKDMTIWISRELLLFNFERLYMWCA